MKRLSTKPRADWRQIVESQGFYYHTIKGETYWDESACYAFSDKDATLLENATNELHQLCLAAVEHVVKNDLYHLFHIPTWFIPTIEESWRRRDPDIYGRFDLVYFDAKFPPKMLEYNADTPTSLLESSVVQYHWLKDCFPEKDQMNVLHQALVERWKTLAQTTLSGDEVVHFTCVPTEREDIGNTDYLRGTAEQAGLQSVLVTLDQTSWAPEIEQLRVTETNQPITALFKLYPWEWLLDTTRENSVAPINTRVFEPAWKMILSNKAILPILWELFPNHPNLLPAYPIPDPFLGRYVQKPLLSREGANIDIVEGCGEEVLESSTGPYGNEGYIYQAFYPLPKFEDNYTVIGSWVVDGRAAGIGIREDASLITKNSSRFVPHFIE